MRIVRLAIAGIGGIFFALAGLYVGAQQAVGNTAQFIVDDAPAAPVVIVLGSSVKADGTPSDVLADRLRVAATLYEAGTVQKILASGDHGRDGYDEVNGMKDFLLELGVAPEDLFLDHAGFDTYDTMYRARNVFGITDALVVTQEFHLPRALYIGRSLGMTVHGVTSDLQQYVKADLFAMRERFANVKAFLNVIFGAKSTYSGDSIDITGDGQVTWDQP